ncbi:MAG: hypothetical protein WDO73_34660 [Ignavibacteriota bacterium]
MNWQTGSLGPLSISAWGGHWNAGYTFMQSRLHPRPFVDYTYGSGTKNPNGNTWAHTTNSSASAHGQAWGSPINSAGGTSWTCGPA